MNTTCPVDIFCSHGPTHKMALCVAIHSSLRLRHELRRSTDTPTSVRRDTVYIRPIGRPSDFPPCVLSRVEISGALRDLGFCGGHSLVVSARPSRPSCVLVVRSPK